MPKKVQLLLDSSGNISDIKFLTNRMSFLNATKRLLNSAQPEFARGAMGVKQGIDRRHWESNEMIKQEIQRMYTGQNGQNVGEHIYQRFSQTSRSPIKRAPRTVEELENAIYQQWRHMFSESSSLRLGDAEPNQALGRMIGQLKPKYEALSRNEFEPFEVRYTTSEGTATIPVDTPKDLEDLYWNANYDFTFNGNLECELMESENSFYFATSNPVASPALADSSEGASAMGVVEDVAEVLEVVAI